MLTADWRCAEVIQRLVDPATGAPVTRTKATPAMTKMKSEMAMPGACVRACVPRNRPAPLSPRARRVVRSNTPGIFSTGDAWERRCRQLSCFLLVGVARPYSVLLLQLLLLLLVAAI
jgi:hypothetical protein